MDFFLGILDSCLHIITSDIIFYTILGGFIGTIAGSLPGLGPSSSLALFIPMTFFLDPMTGIVFLLNIYQGTMYGGRITSILANIPGDSPAIVTCFEGYPMAMKGRAGAAMGISGFSSFFGGLIGLAGLAMFAFPVSAFAIRFGPAEYFGLMVFALSCIGILSGDNPIKGVIMAIIGLICGAIGHDFVSGHIRLTFGMVDLVDGIDLVPMALGAFAVSELFFGIEKGGEVQFIKMKLKLSEMYPTLDDFFRSKFAIIRGAIVGFLIGVLPGAGGTPATFISYAIEKKVSKRSKEFGTGVIEGLAGPESANNASEGGALIPLLTLGIPGSGGTAILLGGLMIWGIRPGPMLFTSNPELVSIIIGGLLVGNVTLLILNIAFIPFFVTLLKVIRPYMNSSVTTLCLIGCYASSFNYFDAWIMLAFGIFGYFGRKLDYPMAPLILGLVLGPKTEDSFRQSLMLAQGDYSIFFESLISTVFLSIGLLMIFMPIMKYIFKKLYKTNAVL